MKKLIALVLMLVVASTSVLALSPMQGLKLVQKDPVTWEPVAGGSATMTIFYGRYFNLVAFGLDKDTDYTLIYYGADGFNDVWPHATCIADLYYQRYWRGGFHKAQGTYNFMPFLTDNVGQKLWVVASDDIDCANNKMVAWNPSEYLFEWNVI